MNRILLEADEISCGVATFGGVRARHVVDVLHGEVGQTLKTGTIGGNVGTGEILSIGTDSGGEPVVSARVRHETASLVPWADLILAPPRPRAMKRLLPQLAAMGVGRIVLVGARKVEKDFWGATLLKEENYRPLLVDGLMQAGTSILPTILVRRAFRRFVNDELDEMFPGGRRIVAHPYGDDPEGPPPRATRGRGRLLLAIGPEGGWTDDEVALLESRGFTRHSLGPRILRTDTAAIALLAQLQPSAGTWRGRGRTP